VTNLVMVMPYRAYVVKAREEGFRICAIWDPTLEKPAYLAELEQRADAFVLTDFFDPPRFEAAVRDAVRDFGADLVYHVGREDSMLATYRLAEELGKAVNSTRSVELLNDKLAMRRLLCEHGVSPVRFAVADHWQDVEHLLDGFELPVVVKPTSLAGSRGVYLLRHRDELAAWGRLLRSYHYDGPVLVEERLRGPEFSVETMSHDGHHEVIGVTRKVLGRPPLFVEAGHVHPLADSPQARQMGELTVELLRLTGYRCGPAHTEVIWTPDGPRIVESQARLGGDKIPRLVELSSGLDVERAIFRTLAGRPPRPPAPHGVARISYFELPVGVVSSVSGLDEARALDFVDELQLPFGPGDRIPVTVDSKSRHGFVIVSGGSEEETARQVEVVRSIVRVEVEAPAPAEPAGVGAGTGEHG
jgi:biotin carboxylase